MPTQGMFWRRIFNHCIKAPWGIVCYGGQPCLGQSGRAIARWLGVSHTWIQKLLREFARNPSEMQRELRVHGHGTIAQLRRAREQTREQKDRGWLREPRRWKVAEFKIGDNVVRGVVPTKASLRPRANFDDIPPDAAFWTSNGAPPLSRWGSLQQRRQRGRWRKRRNTRVPSSLAKWRTGFHLSVIRRSSDCRRVACAVRPVTVKSSPSPKLQCCRRFPVDLAQG
jgi:hypothetical protein